MISRLDFCNYSFYLHKGCQVQKENKATNATVIVMISVISVVAIFLGVILFLAKGNYQFDCYNIISPFNNV